MSLIKELFTPNILVYIWNPLDPGLLDRSLT